jgi:hypothetical protein
MSCASRLSWGVPFLGRINFFRRTIENTHARVTRKGERPFQTKR